MTLDHTADADGSHTGTSDTLGGVMSYPCTADGDVIAAADTSTGDEWTYSYHFAGQITGAVEKTSGGTALAEVTYIYDALGNRIGIDDNGTQTWTLYDGSDPIMDFNSSGTLEMRYLNGPAGDLVDTVLARQSSSGTVAWYLPDRLGTIRDLISNTGTILDHVDYSAFGTQLDESDASYGDRMMGFAGMERDTVTGMNLAVYRVQDLGTGRWTGRDPIGFKGGDANLDRYVGNGPTLWRDPAGEQQGRPARKPAKSRPAQPKPPAPPVRLKPPGDKTCVEMTDAELAAWIKYLERNFTAYNTASQTLSQLASADTAQRGGVTLNAGPISVIPGTILAWLKSVLGKDFDPATANAAQLLKASKLLAAAATSILAALSDAYDEDLCRAFLGPNLPPIKVDVPPAAPPAGKRQNR